MPHSPTSPAHTANPTVLVVDDDPAMLALCKKILEQAGCSVLSASGSSEALKLCKGHQGSIDLLVTDLVLPPPEFSFASSDNEFPHDKRRHSWNVIEIEARDVQVDWFVGHHRQQALGGYRNLADLFANDHNFRIPLVLPPLGNDQIIGAVQETVSNVLHLGLIRHVGEHD